MAHDGRQTAPYAWGGILVIRQGHVTDREKPCHKPTYRYESSDLPENDAGRGREFCVNAHAIFPTRYETGYRDRSCCSSV
jgi:hypothetical protein